MILELRPRQKLWINGQSVLDVEIPITAYSSSAVVSFSFGSDWNYSLADISLWSRCLLPIEIRAAYDQKLSIDKINISKYILDHQHR